MDDLVGPKQKHPCGYDYPPCPDCGQTPECAPDCPGIAAVLGRPDIYLAGVQPSPEDRRNPS